MTLAQPDGFFDGEFVKGVHAVLDAGGLNGGLCAVDAGFDLLITLSVGVIIISFSVGGCGTHGIVNDPLHGYQDP